MTTATGSAAVAVVTAVTVIVCTVAVVGVSAITTKPSGTSILKTTLQVFPTGETATRDEQPSFTTRYWQQQQQQQQQRDIASSVAAKYDNNEEDIDSESQLSHKLSPAQQAHILDDIRRHNQQQQLFGAPSSEPTAPPSQTTFRHDVVGDVGEDKRRTQDEAPVSDQLQQLLQINGVAAADDEVVAAAAAVDNQDDDRHGKQRSIENSGPGSSGVGWQPQAQQAQLLFNNRPQQRPSLSPYVPPPPAAVVATVSRGQYEQTQHQQQYYQTTSSAVPTVQHHQQRHQQQIFVTTPSSASQSPPPVDSTGSDDHHNRHNQHTEQYNPQQQRTPAVSPSDIVGVDTDHGGGGGGELDADIEQQIRQQLTKITGGGNYTILTSPDGASIAGSAVQRLPSHFAGSASNDNVQYIKIGGGGGGGSGSSTSRNRLQLQQQLETSAAAASSVFKGAGHQSSASTAINTGNRNTIVKTVVVRQKPSSPPQPVATAPPVVAPPQQTWSIDEQQQLDELARQVLPPGVAQYEIIRAGGIDDGGKNGVADAVAAATAGTRQSGDTKQVGGGTQQQQQQQQQSPVVGKKKPVTFVILEERPDGTVRVRGVEKKQHVVGGGGGGDANADPPGPVVADDEQLQQLVDRLNRGELRLPTTGGPVSSSKPKTGGVDSAPAASTTVATPLPAFVPSFASTASPPLKSNGGYGMNKHRDSSPSTYFSTITPPQTTTASTHQQQQYQNFFLPTAAPTAAVSTTVGQQNRYNHHHHHHHQQQQQQQQFYSTPTITTSASSSTPLPVNNSTVSYHNNKGGKEGAFSGALRRRGFYAMAKYMRQAGVDAVLEETGPFTVFVPTDKAFRALLVQLGGPDRAEDKFRENPRLLIGLLLHHVVPGAFKAADLMAGDEMTGVSLAGTQLRANLYARQLYDNRWNDIEVLTVNGARVLDNIVPAASAATDDGSVADESTVGPGQQRRDMVLSSGAEGGGTGETGENQQIIAIGHAVDRVLFPLPVGDILATMRADRQRRYSVFLRAVDEHCSPSVRSLLTGSRTITVFAPMDEAFRVRRGSGNYSSSSSSGSMVDWLLREDAASKFKKRNRRRIADQFVLSHVVLAGPGDPPMYTAGLRFYQVRDTAYRITDGSGEGSAAAAAAAAEGEDDGPAEGINGDGDDVYPTLPPADGEKSRYYQLTVYKDSGRIRLNGGAAQVLVRNVPATNGVLHGLDAPLV